MGCTQVFCVLKINLCSKSWLASLEDMHSISFYVQLLFSKESRSYFTVVKDFILKIIPEIRPTEIFCFLLWPILLPGPPGKGVEEFCESDC